MKKNGKIPQKKSFQFIVKNQINVKKIIVVDSSYNVSEIF